MKNKNKIALYTALSAVALGLLGTGVASAGGMGMCGGGFGFVAATPDEVASRHQTMFQNEATLLGISVDDVKSGWAEGKTIGEIATAHGITADQLAQKMKDARGAQMKSQLQALVDKGIITQAQADSRLKVMQNFSQNRKGNGAMGKGMRGGFRF